ncbi:MAG: orotate phosphoribosyltransferase [Clostridia bacterium]|nr:orotate phosphoribosyltransferase [Clostridia bacterium]
MESRATQIHAKRNGKVIISAIPGHFATQHSHVNYCIDMTKVKSQMSMAKAAAQLIAETFINTPVDTIITLERTKMVGAFLANALSNAGINVNHDMNVISPEVTNDMLVLRDNLAPYVWGKRVLILSATATTGLTAKSAVAGIRYYGGEPVGVACVFGGEFEIEGVPVVNLINVDDVPAYASYSPNLCPLCKAGKKIDALINSYGYSKI